MDGTVLIADDDRTIRTVLTQAMTRAGMQVHATSSLTTLMRWVGEGRGDLVITDVAMPDGNGLEMIPRISELRPDLPVIVISAQNTIMTAIRATEAEAWDYLPKPFDLPDLMHRSALALEESHMRRMKTRSKVVDKPQADAAVVQPRAEAGSAEPVSLAGRSPEMQALFQSIARIMNTDIPVLISGDSGTGKSRVARAVHGLSQRNTAGFQILDPALPGDRQQEDQLLAKLSGGTLVIDEPAEYSPEEQLKLNRFLDRFTQMDSAPPRLITTSQQDLTHLLAGGQIRADLYYRLKGAELHVPTLAQRISDIGVLAEEFLRSDDLDDQGPGLGRSNGVARAFSPEAEQILLQHPWPGNVRELKITIRQLVAISTRPVISAEDVRDVLAVGSAASAIPPVAPVQQMIGNVSPGAMAATGYAAQVSERPAEEGSLSDSVERHLRRYFDLHQDSLPAPGLYQRILKEMEIPLFEIALDATHGNQARCAELLGINRNTLRKKLTALDIHVTRGRKLM